MRDGSIAATFAQFVLALVAAVWITVELVNVIS